MAKQPISLMNDKSVLKGFSKSKSPGPNGWTIQLFLESFDIMGQGIMDAMEESWNTGEVYEKLNSTYIVLIPKVNKPISFSDYRPISLCNLVYKAI